MRTCKKLIERAHTQQTMELAVIHVITERCAELEAQLQQYRDIYDVRFVRDDDGTYYLCQHHRRVRVNGAKLCVWMESHDPHPSEKMHIRMHNSSIMRAELDKLGKLHTHIVCELRFGDPETPAMIFTSDIDEGIFYLHATSSVPIMKDNAREIFRSIATYCPPKVIVYDYYV
jgi:hypothetical protein